MKREEATVIIKNCLEAEYETGKYEKLIANILTTQYVKMNRVVGEAYIREAFRDSIGSYTILGNYEDTTKQKIVLLEVRLKNAGSLQNARTMQRNFVADFLRSGSLGRQDAALVAFIPPDANDWRFSLVKMEYSLGIIEGKIKTNEELTPARRWSFLVGKHEKSHTAQSRLLPLVMEESHGTTLKELEKSFDVETVTDEFFGQYKECFFRFKDEIDRVIASSEHDMAHFESIGLDTANFAKKTLGQLAFLYFLQKKGWFGVASDNEWGKGPKDFLRKLFERREKYGNNFFNDILEPLFYEALATDRGDSALYTRLNNCRIPFLNGGLFEPMKGYSWETTDLTISDEVFSNTHKMKNGDIGDGIFDVFDRYNFTVSEDEPLEKEVAVDPEMLGKIFENLLEIKDRKSTGAFYTPRPIVHYMCQESLIEYLAHTDTTLPHTDIEFFIRESEATLENDRTTKKKIEEKSQNGYQYSGTYTYKTPESIRSRAKMLDDALASVRIADPAVGSGAFPLGLINEIVRARQILAIYTGSQKSTYDLKLHAIQENIYGVDLNPGAVEICQLRLWLSLIVDETVPHPLPNLNYRIIQGNSLIEEYEGIKLYDPKLLSYTKLVGKNEFNDERIDLFTLENSQSNRLYELLQHKLKKFIETSERTKKQTLKREIDQMKYDLIEITLREQGKEEKIAEIRRLREDNITPFFIWQLEFCEVFQEKGGFDIVIGNPPYIEEKDHKEIFQPVASSSLGRRFYQGKMNFFFFFFHLGLDLLRTGGSVNLITTNYYITSAGGKRLRTDMKDRSSILELINFDKLKIFESAKGQNNIITFLKKGSFNEQAKCLFTKKTGLATPSILSRILERSDEKTLYFKQDQDKIYFGPGLSIRTKVDVDTNIDFSTADTEKLGSLFDISQGVVEGPDRVSKENATKFNLKENDGVFIFHKNELGNIPYNQDEQQFFKRYLDTKNIRKYCISESDKYLLYISKENCNNIHSYPNIEKHLLKYRSIMEQRRETLKGSNLWFQLHWPRKLKYFEQPKLICKGMFDTPEFTYDEEGYYVGMSFSIIWQKDEQYHLKYLLGLMNSKLGKIWFHQNGKRRGVGVDIGVQVFREFPVPKIALFNQPIVTQIESLVDQILKIKSQSVHQDTFVNTATPSLRATPQEGNKTIGTPQERNNRVDTTIGTPQEGNGVDTSELEQEIDRLVYELYGLTSEEIAVVEGSSKQ